MSRMLPTAATTLATVLFTLAFAPIGARAAPGAGPELKKCGKPQADKAKARTCRAQNKANRIAFNQIKNSLFVGVRGDGAEVEDLYCADGKFESRTTDSYGTGVTAGSRWRVADAVVKRGGTWIDAFIIGSEGFQVGIQRRGTRWEYGVASLGRILEPGKVEKKAATAACDAL